MKAVYPTQNFLPDDYARDVWYALLKDIPYPDANRAVMEILKTSPYPPTVADITGRVYRCIAGNEMTETEAWSRVRVAIRNSGYNAETEFAKLPEACQRAVGSAANLRELALMDAETVESVEQSHFVKIFRSVVDRQEKAGQIDIRMAIERKKQEAARLLEAEKVKGIDSVGRKEHHTPADIARIEQRVESMWKERDERESGKAV